MRCFLVGERFWRPGLPSFGYVRKWNVSITGRSCRWRSFTCGHTNKYQTNQSPPKGNQLSSSKGLPDSQMDYSSIPWSSSIDDYDMTSKLRSNLYRGRLPPYDIDLYIRAVMIPEKVQTENVLVSILSNWSKINLCPGKISILVCSSSLAAESNSFVFLREETYYNSSSPPDKWSRRW